MPGPVGCAFGLAGWAKATADATPAAITTASTAPMAIGRNRMNLFFKLVPFYGLRILDSIVGAVSTAKEPPRGYLPPLLPARAAQGLLSRMETGGAPFFYRPQSRKTS